MRLVQRAVVAMIPFLALWRRHGVKTQRQRRSSTRPLLPWAARKGSPRSRRTHGWALSHSTAAAVNETMTSNSPSAALITCEGNGDET